MTRFRALIRKECVVLFASPVAYVVLTTVALLTAILFFEHLRLYNQQLFLYASSNMGGFDSDSISTSESPSTAPRRPTPSTSSRSTR